ncbi:MAG: histidinol dehydrogenase [Bacteroidetes bacterium]|nr:histidinol dehydrogenase [Bacteroidota bacterium]
MHVYTYPPQRMWPQLLARPVSDDRAIETVVTEILKHVQREGDAAIRRYVERFDGVLLHSFEVSGSELQALADQVDPKLREAIECAHKNIERFHRAQLRPDIYVETLPGVQCWRRAVPIERVGLYIPGGTAPLFSTLLMLATPARIAGCDEIILCTPSGGVQRLHPALAFAALLTGVDRVFTIGGAQAIGAMAFGSASVPSVDKIFGPGNKYVTEAKQLVSRYGVAIDLPAGPSEVAVIADDSCDPHYVAADLLSQAEHGRDSQVLLVSDSERVIRETLAEIKRQLPLLPRRTIAEAALASSRAILVQSVAEGLELLDRYAPEHLIIACREDERLAAQVQNAGSIFLGNYSPESAGDYASGTNHTLPTGGYARAYSGASLDAFMKYITVQKLSLPGLTTLSDAIIPMAEAEGLRAHANAVRLRIGEEMP